MVDPVTANKRLIAALGYLFTPMVPLVAMRGEEQDPFIRKHARQGLLWAVPFLVLLVACVILMILTIQQDILFVCLSPFLFLLPFVPGAIFARRVFLGGDVTFPI